MISQTLNQLQALRARWLHHSTAICSTIVPRLVTWSQPIGQWWCETFSRDGLSRLADHWTTLVQDSISSTPLESKGKAVGEVVELYSPQGTIQTLNNQAKGVFRVTDVPSFRSRWPKNAYDLDLSATSVLAHGIVTHVTAPDDARQEFVQHVMEVRKQGGYDPTIFQETRHILGQSSQSQNTQFNG